MEKVKLVITTKSSDDGYVIDSTRCIMDSMEDAIGLIKALTCKLNQQPFAVYDFEIITLKDAE